MKKLNYGSIVRECSFQNISSNPKIFAKYFVKTAPIFRFSMNISVWCFFSILKFSNFKFSNVHMRDCVLIWNVFGPPFRFSPVRVNAENRSVSGARIRKKELSKKRMLVNKTSKQFSSYRYLLIIRLCKRMTPLHAITLLTCFNCSHTVVKHVKVTH